ncbi:MAG: glycosyltransferase family 87 protein [Bacteroidia bacterium]
MGIALLTSGTYDAGDSVMHYQIAHYAFQHPENFLSHWGKPFFTLVSSPFAALGFTGMQLFQCLLAFGTGWMTYKNALRLGLKPAWFAPLLVLAAPEFFLSQMSGLTEPFFAFILTLGVFLMLHQRRMLGALAFSMLPFVRTEGFLLLPTIAVFLAFKRQWDAIPALGMGTVVYAVLGTVFLGDPLWIWNQNPYANMAMNYGVGTWGHFPQQYVFVVGIPIYALTIGGLLAAPMRWWLGWSKARTEEILLVAGTFGTYFFAHMYFWATGTGHSLGMLRVMIAIVPMGALLAMGSLDALGRLLGEGRLRFTKVIVGMLAAYTAAFPAIPNPAAIHADELELSVDQRLLIRCIDYMRENDLMSRKVYCVHPSGAFFAGIDPFNPEKFRSLNRYAADNPPAGCLLLIDSWFAKIESGMVPSDFDAQPNRYTLRFKAEDRLDDLPIGVYLYEKI